MLPAKALAQAAKLFADGASLVDVGAESTRPNATPLTPAQEWERLAPVLPELLRRYSGRISLDTFHPQTARRALQFGDVIINDVTGMRNPAMADVALRYKARCIISHLPAVNVQYAHRHATLATVQPIVTYLRKSAASLIAQGLPASCIIVDPGIGFGKTPDLNWQLLHFAEHMPEYPVMVGYSRKRFLGEYRMQLRPNIQAGLITAFSGAAYLRVHDVAGHAKVIDTKV